MNNHRKMIGWVLVVAGGLVGLSGLCLMANAVLYLANVLHLDASQDVPLETKLFAIFCLLLPMILLGTGGVIGGRHILRTIQSENLEKKG